MSVLFINKTSQLNNLKTRTPMNAKISLFVIYVEAIIYLLLCNLHDCTFKYFSNNIIFLKDLGFRLIFMWRRICFDLYAQRPGFLESKYGSRQWENVENKWKKRNKESKKEIQLFCFFIVLSKKYSLYCNTFRGKLFWRRIEAATKGIL